MGTGLEADWVGDRSIDDIVDEVLGGEGLCGVALGLDAEAMEARGFAAHTGRGHTVVHRSADPSLVYEFNCGVVDQVRCEWSCDDTGWLWILAECLSARLDATHGAPRGRSPFRWELVEAAEIVLELSRGYSGRPARMTLILRSAHPATGAMHPLDPEALAQAIRRNLNTLSPEAFGGRSIAVHTVQVDRLHRGVRVSIDASSPEDGAIHARLQWPESPLRADQTLSARFEAALTEVLSPR